MRRAIRERLDELARQGFVVAAVRADAHKIERRDAHGKTHDDCRRRHAERQARAAQLFRHGPKICSQWKAARSSPVTGKHKGEPQ